MATLRGAEEHGERLVVEQHLVEEVGERGDEVRRLRLHAVEDELVGDMPEVEPQLSVGAVAHNLAPLGMQRRARPAGRGLQMRRTKQSRSLDMHESGLSWLRGGDNDTRTHLGALVGATGGRLGRAECGSHVCLPECLPRSGSQLFEIRRRNVSVVGSAP